MLTKGFLGAALLVGSLCVAPALAEPTAQTARLSSNVRAGGIDSHQKDEPGSRIRRSHAVGLIRAPIDEVTRVVLDYDGYRRFMPHFAASRVLSRRGNRALVYVEVSALQGLATLWVQMDIRMLPATASATRVVRARMIKGNVKGFEAQWRVTPIRSDQTLVAFELCADPDFSIPFGDGIVSDYNEKEARSSVLALRRYVGRRATATAR
jgi:ribosome-associated toxin RatA of RatAB toxin-antitoxin module